MIEPERDLLGASSVVLVEGLSDQAAIEALAVRRGRDLAAEGVAVVPMGGAHAIGPSLRRLGHPDTTSGWPACVMPARNTTSSAHV